MCSPIKGFYLPSRATRDLKNVLFWFRGVIPTAKSDSAVSYLLRSLTPQSHAYCRVWLAQCHTYCGVWLAQCHTYCGVWLAQCHTSCGVWLAQCHTYCGVDSRSVIPTVESDSCSVMPTAELFLKFEGRKSCEWTDFVLNFNGLLTIPAPSTRRGWVIILMVFWLYLLPVQGEVEW